MKGYGNTLYRRFGNIVFTEHSISNCNDLDAIINELESCYNNCIGNRLFSKRNWEWTDFSEEDKQHSGELL
jgi:hypothetical protein